jgi:hypothetical protein
MFSYWPTRWPMLADVGRSRRSRARVTDLKSYSNNYKWVFSNTAMSSYGWVHIIENPYIHLETWHWKMALEDGTGGARG